MMSSNRKGLLSPSDIADLANVSRSAVSNWRKRSDDFPDPVAGTQAKPLFEQSAIEVWLTERGIHIQRDHGESRAWAAMNVLRGELPVEAARDLFLSVACVRKLTATDPNIKPAWDRILSSAGYGVRDHLREAGRGIDGDVVFVSDSMSDRALTEFVQVVTTIAPEHLAQVADFILDRLARSQVKAGAEYGFVGSRTSALLANLAAAQPDRDVVYDPACGFAVALVAAADAGAGTAHLVGSDINVDALRIARQRAYLHDVSLDLVRGNVLERDPVPDLNADVVIVEPPFGMRVDSVFRMTDARFEFGAPPAAHSEMAWIQHAIAHLNASGRAFVLTPHGPLFRGGQEQTVRSELIRRGAIEAIVGLPPKMLPHISIPLALWILRRPTPPPTDPILFLDASGEESPEEVVPQWLASAEIRPAQLTAEVSVANILAENGGLSPAKWMMQDETQPDTISKDYGDGWRQIWKAAESLHGFVSIPLSVPNVGGARTQTVEELVREGLVELRLGKPTARYDGLSPDLRERVVTAADVRDGNLPVFDHGPEGLPDSMEVTRPGEVLVTTMGTIRARVDEAGGHLPGTGVFQLRIAHPEVLSPAYLAVVLAGSWNSRLMSGSTIQKANVRELEVPLLSPGQQQALLRAITSVDRIREDTDRLKRGGDRVRQALLDAVRFGIPLAPDHTDEIDDNDTGEAN